MNFALTNLEHGGLVAIGAAEIVVKDDRNRGAKAIAAEQALGIAVFRTGFFRKRGRQAQRTAGSGRDDPLENDDEDGRSHQAGGQDHVGAVANEKRIRHKTQAGVDEDGSENEKVSG